MAKLKGLPPRLTTLATRVSLPPKEPESFYRSKEWLGLMAHLKKVRGKRCEDCGAVQSKDTRIIGDHIVERRDGGAELDPSNIRLLCLPCHNRKTARERAKRSRSSPEREA